MSGLERKCVGGLCELKDGEQGEVTAVVATLNVVDREGDVLLPGAFPDGAPVKMSAYGHDVVLDGAAPVGKGTIREVADKAVFQGKFFLSTERGREAFHTVKELGPDGEWSFGFPRGVQTVELTNEWRAKGARRVIRGIQPVEVSPVFRGASIGTRTLAAKCDGCGDVRGRGCSCGTRGPSLAAARALRARVEETLKASAPPQPPDLKAWVPGFGQEAIARRVIRVAMRRWEIKTAPQLHWFRPNGRVWGETLGGRDPIEIWLQSGLDDAETALTAAHEAWHCRELERGEPANEQLASSMARKLLPEIDDPRFATLNGLA